MPWSPAPCASSALSAAPLRCSIALSTPWAMSGDWEPIDTLTPHDAPSKPFIDRSYPMPRMVSRTMAGMSAYAVVVTSPATCTCPVVIRVSTATRLRGSWASSASRMASLIWSAILSGWPSVTDSEVNKRRTMLPFRHGGRYGYRQLAGLR
jgi:hypothetical protein